METKHATQVFLEFHSQENLAGLDETSISGYVLPNLSERVVQAIGHQHKPMIVATTAENFEKNLETTKHLRNKEGFTNLHLCLPEITTSTEFVELKKKVSVEGLHRGGSFKLFCTIANPASALNFGEIVESGLDGVVIDFLSLINKTYGKKFTLEELKKVNDKSVLILINQLLNLCQQFKVFSLLDNILIGEDNSLASYLGKGLKGVVSSASDFEDTKKSLSRAEKQLLTR